MQKRIYTDWKKVWADKSNLALDDGQLAEKLAVSRQAVSESRRRHNAPPSPGKRGGIKRNQSVGKTITLRPTEEQRLLWYKQAKSAGVALRQWIEEQADLGCAKK